jgi:hypothetical protein
MFRHVAIVVASAGWKQEVPELIRECPGTGALRFVAWLQFTVHLLHGCSLSLLIVRVS